MFLSLCSWRDGTMQQQSYTAEAVGSFPAPLSCGSEFRVLACPHFWSPVVLANCGHRGRYGQATMSIFGGFLILQQ